MPAKKKTEKVAETEVLEVKESVEAAEAAPETPVEEVKVKKTRTRKTAAKKAEETAAAEASAEAPAEEVKVKKTRTRKTAAKKAEEAAAEVTAEAPAEEVKVKKTRTRKTAAKKAEEAAAEVTAEAPAEEVKVKKTRTRKTAAKKAEEAAAEAAPVVESAPAVEGTPRRSVAFIGSECYPFVKTGGLGDVMYALPKALADENCDVRVILPNYKCIPQKFKDLMTFRGSFDMDLCSDGRTFYVGIMEYENEGVTYDFIDNEEFFSEGKPYTNLIDDIPKYCYFGKAALAALNYLNWIPDIVHCHDWQAGLVPVYLKTLFQGSPVGGAKSIITIHNLKFQGSYDVRTIQYWTGLPDYVFNGGTVNVGYDGANMLKGGLSFADIITTVSNTYADEIQTEYYGEQLDGHLRYHSGKLTGIVNGIDCDIWNTATDGRLAVNYDITDAVEKKKANKLALQEELEIEKDESKFVIGLISRLTDQKGLDLINAIIPDIMDDKTQIVVLGTGDPMYEESFRFYEGAYKGRISSSIMYDETRAHHIYAGSDALLVPSRFEPCGLTQLIAMHYGTLPIVRETGGLKDTVEPYNKYENSGNGFTFDRYEAELLRDAIIRAKDLYFNERERWDEMVERDMAKDVSWKKSAKLYKDLYLSLTQW